MNIYRRQFVAICPNNGEAIVYDLSIQTDAVIMAEDIVQATTEARSIGKPYHENIADFLHDRLGGQQKIIAFHHGVEIETLRGWE